MSSLRCEPSANFRKYSRWWSRSSDEDTPSSDSSFTSESEAGDKQAQAGYLQSWAHITDALLVRFNHTQSLYRCAGVVENNEDFKKDRQRVIVSSIRVLERVNKIWKEENTNGYHAWRSWRFLGGFCYRDLVKPNKIKNGGS